MQEQHITSLVRECAVINRHSKRSGYVSAAAAAAADGNILVVDAEVQHVNDDGDINNLRDEKKHRRGNWGQTRASTDRKCCSYTLIRRMGWIALLVTHQHMMCCTTVASNVRRQNNSFIASSTAAWTRKQYTRVVSAQRRQQKVGRANSSYRPSIMVQSMHLDSSEIRLKGSNSDDAFMTETHLSASSTSTFTTDTTISSNTSSSCSQSSSSTSSLTIADTIIVPMDTPARQSLPSHLSLRPIPGKGLGVISLKSISMGEVVGEYKGEVMAQEVKDRRYLPSCIDQQTDDDRQWIQSRRERGQTISGCYLYGISVPPKRGDTTSTATTIYVDAEDEYESLWTRFLNHAPLPYGNVHPKSIHESYDGKPRVWFVANRNIAVGEEICFDYGDDYWLEGDNVV
ncbi:hypothetical protein ACHAWU_000859 [Discostella pseudostelligera]|uniref:SET domain-containing protein n=1 Tax=Discostella pseudostelligera TaxID=259834 RepID=A0ABD3M684_9STRA